jgi:hypothetical protein
VRDPGWLQGQVDGDGTGLCELVARLTSLLVSMAHDDTAQQGTSFHWRRLQASRRRRPRTRQLSEVTVRGSRRLVVWILLMRSSKEQFFSPKSLRRQVEVPISSIGIIFKSMVETRGILIQFYDL